MKLHSHFAGLGTTFSSPVQPQPLDNPELVSSNPVIADLLGCGSFSQEQLTRLCNGESLGDQSPVAMVYAGHQFGSWVPRLGDGRAMLLGEVQGTDGKLYDLHLKGAGLTPYSRNGDGRAVLRSTIREYLCSEAMHALGIPTTRPLCLINSSTPVYREKTETGAAMIRVAESHVRFGTFEYFSYSQQYDALQTLADYVIARHFPDWTDDADRVEKLLAQAIQSTAEMIAHWQAAGWCHGVMNTDNMSILGHTIDYGPFGFLDGFDAAHICNHSDWQGRYAFSRQPHIGHWNCTALAQALLPILPGGKEKAEQLLEDYPDHFAKKYSQLIRRKFGLEDGAEGDSALIDEIFTLMQKERTDYPLFFRRLSEGQAEDLFIDRESFQSWYKQYQQRLQQEGRDEATVRESMLAANPAYVLRNHLLQIAIDKAESGDYSEVNRLLEAIQQPFTEREEFADYLQLPPDWAEHLEISCSS
ncbi:protein adenylyltransferase SelO [Parendozoicomonas haliclonae]|uniref:Protein nucleotidyltransferase YdiU n=1 Tax=Parendozoicomonas haliclonae TaxID=1960125 RepID=A0A1X7AIJ9_9GAMM|nr:YdiU family protein [Parendozoicomonas haliclonae]SMA45340.1 hypothetical protein EHSB41UT_01895 [Parendozoicomonas haliclonae]